MARQRQEPNMSLKPVQYRHFQCGEYAVYGVATHSETREPMVVYRPLYGEGELWVRPLAMFQETVQHDKRTVSRFEFITAMELPPPE
jgi:hypothetical protein